MHELCYPTLADFFHKQMIVIAHDAIRQNAYKLISFVCRTYYVVTQHSQVEFPSLALKFPQYAVRAFYIVE